MKKLLLLLSVVTLAVANVGAQSFEKGDWTLDVQMSDIGLNHSLAKDTNLKMTSFSVATGGGYFIFDKFAVDALLGFRYSKAERSPSYTSFSFGVGARYYPVGNLFAQLRYVGTTQKNATLTDHLLASIGYDLFVLPNVFFEPAAYYNKMLLDGGIDGLGLSLAIGLKF